MQRFCFAVSVQAAHRKARRSATDLLEEAQNPGVRVVTWRSHHAGLLRICVTLISAIGFGTCFACLGSALSIFAMSRLESTLQVCNSAAYAHVYGVQGQGYGRILTNKLQASGAMSKES